MADHQRFHLAADSDAAHAAAGRLFETVGHQLRPLLPTSAEFLHIGATAIPGCLTKGDLDIVVRVDHADFATVDSCLAKLYARNGGSTRTEEFSAFEDTDQSPHLGIQLTVRGGALDLFHCFADALRADPALVQRYNDLKRAQQDQLMMKYRAAKNDFISSVLNTRTSSR